LSELASSDLAGDYLPLSAIHGAGVWISVSGSSPAGGPLWYVSPSAEAVDWGAYGTVTGIAGRLSAEVFPCNGLRRSCARLQHAGSVP
jgi:hypothetical protein